MPSLSRGLKIIIFFLIYVLVTQIVFGVVFEIGIMFGFFSESPNFMVLIIFTQIISFFIPFIMYLLFTRQRMKDVLLFSPLGAKNLFLVIGLTLLFLPITSFISALSTVFFDNIVAEVLEHTTNVYPFWLAILAIGITPSIFEELMLRGAIYKEYENSSISKAAIINGLIFGIVHLNLQQFFYAALLGILFTYIMYYTRSIVAPIIMHFIINASNVSLMYAIPFLQGLYTDNNGYVDESQLYYEEPNILFIVLIMGGISLLFLPPIIYIFKELISHNKLRHRVV